MKRVYTFGNGQAEGRADMKNLLGGKGANLAEMNLIGVPVPPGFTITTEVCTEYNKQGKDAVVKLLEYLRSVIYDILSRNAFPVGDTLCIKQLIYLGLFVLFRFDVFIHKDGAVDLNETCARSSAYTL